MQRIVDRRFNRPRHAADEVLADMADRVRDAVDPSLIVGALATAAIETLEPAQDRGVDQAIAGAGQPRPLRNGLAARSRPTVVSGPWPGNTLVSSGRVRTLRTIDSINCR